MKTYEETKINIELSAVDLYTILDYCEKMASIATNKKTRQYNNLVNVISKLHDLRIANKI